jgi:hypothetical protein
MLVDDPAEASASPLSAFLEFGGDSAVGEGEGAMSEQDDDPYWAYGPLHILPRLLSLPPPLETTVEEQARWHAYMVHWAQHVYDRGLAYSEP